MLLWVHLLLSANHHKKEFLWNGSVITIKPGQFITGRKQLAEETGIPETTIERILTFFEKDLQIGQQKTTKYRLITILKWTDYQITDNKRTTSGQQADTNNNDNKENNENKNSDSAESQEEPLVYEPIKKTRPTFNPLGVEIIKEMETVDSKNKTYYANTTQRKACDFLLNEYGLEEVKKRIMVLPKTNKMPYFPTITTPVQLKDKWVQLQDAVERKRGELKEKNKVAFI